LGESSQIVCPRCTGQGTIRGTESLALSILRVIEEDAMKENTGRIVVQLPVNVATYLLNEKRQSIFEIEQRQKIGVVIVPNTTLETPHYEIQRIKTSEIPQTEATSSYDLASEFKEEELELPHEVAKEKVEEPAVKGVVPLQPAPQQKPKAVEQEEGFLKRLWSNLFGVGAEEEIKAKPSQPSPGRKTGGTAQRPSKSTGTGQRQGARKKQARRSEGRKTESRKTEGRKQRSGAAQGRGQSSAERPAKAEQQPVSAKGDAASAETSTEQSQRAASSRRGKRGGRRRRRDPSSDDSPSGRPQSAQRTGDSQTSQMAASAVPREQPSAQPTRQQEARDTSVETEPRSRPETTQETTQTTTQKSSQENTARPKVSEPGQETKQQTAQTPSSGEHSSADSTRDVSGSIAAAEEKPSPVSEKSAAPQSPQQSLPFESVQPKSDAQSQPSTEPYGSASVGSQQPSGMPGSQSAPQSQPRSVANSGVKDSDDSGIKDSGAKDPDIKDSSIKDSGIKDSASQASGGSHSQSMTGSASPDQAAAQSGERAASQPQEPPRQKAGLNADIHATSDAASTVSPISSGYSPPAGNAGTDSEHGFTPRTVSENQDDDADVLKQHEPRISKS
jgi:ribonuclease E